MRILFLSHYFPPEVNAPALRTYEHCHEWARMGHDVHVITCVPSHPRGKPFGGYQRCWYQCEVKEGIRVHRVFTFLAPNKGTYKRALNYLSFVPTALWRALRLGEFDIIIATSPQFFCAVAGWLAGALKGVPWVFELRDLWPDSIAAVGAVRPSLPLRLLEKLELHLYKDAKGVVCVTKSFVENLGRRGIPERKCIFIPNGVNPEDWDRQEVGEIRTDHAIAADQTMVSYIGTVGMAHALGVVVECAKRLAGTHPEVKFFIVGDGAELEKLKAMAGRENLDNLHFTGLVSHGEAMDYLAASDVVIVHLKRSELFKTVLPSKMFEAMAAGKPIILGVEGEAKEVMQRAGAGICIPPDDPKALEDAVLSLSANPRRRKEMGKSGREFVAREFSRKAWAAKYESWLTSLVADSCPNIPQREPSSS